MSVVWYTLWFVIAVGLLVTIHEFGHFWVARRLGFKVLRFSVGFGQPLWSRRVGPDRTEIAIAPIPLGGYVKLLDEREGPVPPEDLARSFTRKHPFQRILVLLAGPGFNILFAILVLAGIMCVNGITQYLPVVGDVTPGSIAAGAGLRSGDTIVAINGSQVGEQQGVIFGLLDAMSSRGDADLTVRNGKGEARSVDLNVSDPTARRRLTALPDMFTGLGFQFWEPPMPPVLSHVLPDGPAARAGLQAGDRILSINGQAVKDFDDVVAQVTPHPGGTISLAFERDGQAHTVQVEVSSEEADGKYVGRIEAEGELPTDIPYPPGMVRHLSVSPVAALGRATEEAWDMTALQGTLFWRMMLGQVSLRNLSGPVSIAQYAGQSASEGASAFLDFLVLISLSLGFLNLLPIPILDGGQIVFQLVEWVKGSPMSERAQAFGQQVGIALLILLMGVALFNDIARQFS
ncbi:MAG TPA: RIP metalloprotease RseP [Steroidobacteraceae bacterium]|jgi:regulator of sigma E protease|nr:RIP metalloprotease RseP [Steroidobacteraceae bacterium]